MVDGMNIFLYDLVGPRVFQLAVKLAKVFERKCQLNWKVQESTTSNTRRPNVNKMDSCFVII